MNKAPTTKRIEQYLVRIETLEKQFNELVSTEAAARKEIEQKFFQQLAQQREEIMHLREELIRARQDKRRRNARALTKFKSE